MQEDAAFASGRALTHYHQKAGRKIDTSRLDLRKNKNMHIKAFLTASAESKPLWQR